MCWFLKSETVNTCTTGKSWIVSSLMISGSSDFLIYWGCSRCVCIYIYISLYETPGSSIKVNLAMMIPAGGFLLWVWWGDMMLHTYHAPICIYVYIYIYMYIYIYVYIYMYIYVTCGYSKFQPSSNYLFIVYLLLHFTTAMIQPTITTSATKPPSVFSVARATSCSPKSGWNTPLAVAIPVRATSLAATAHIHHWYRVGTTRPERLNPTFP